VWRGADAGLTRAVPLRFNKKALRRWAEGLRL